MNITRFGHNLKSMFIKQHIFGRMELTKIAAIIYATLMGLTILFQFALAAGMPWGEYSMGGKYPGTYPQPMRLAAVLFTPILAYLGLIVLSAADLLAVGMVDNNPWLIHVAFGFAIVSFVMNSITRSKKERNLWAPITLVMLICVSYVAYG